MKEIKKNAFINYYLKRIANALLINASFTENLGLLNGKMGIALFFYHYARYLNNKLFEEYADELIDEIYTEINHTTQVSFENGLSGIGWGIEYLVKNKFVEAETDEVLAEIDSSIYSARLQSPLLINNGNDIFAYGLYYIMRLLNHKINDRDLNTIVKKYQLIFLADECERILLQKLYQRYGIESLSIDTINSFIWFLLEMNKLNLFPFKIKKVLDCIPEYSVHLLIDTDLNPEKSLLACFTRKVIQGTSNVSVKKLLEDTLDQYRIRIIGTGNNKNRSDASNFIKNAWQSLIYQPYKVDTLLKSKSFNFVYDDSYLDKTIGNLTKDNIGLTGLAGFGIGLMITGTKYNENLKNI